MAFLPPQAQILNVLSLTVDDLVGYFWAMFFLEMLYHTMRIQCVGHGSSKLEFDASRDTICSHDFYVLPRI